MSKLTNKEKKKKQRIKILVVFIILTLFAILVYALNDFYRVDNTQTVTVDEHGVCKKVTDNSGKDIFVPTKTAAEWEAFRNNLPSGVTLDECCDPDMGNPCEESACVYAGTIQCDGSCGGKSNKPYGTPCGGNNPCKICNGGNCVAETVTSAFCGGGYFQVIALYTNTPWGTWTLRDMAKNWNDKPRYAMSDYKLDDVGCPSEYRPDCFAWYLSSYGGYWRVINPECDGESHDWGWEAENSNNVVNKMHVTHTNDEGLWTIYYCGDNRYAFKNKANGKYISGDDGPSCPAACSRALRDTIGSHELWEICCSGWEPEPPPPPAEQRFRVTAWTGQQWEGEIGDGGSKEMPEGCSGCDCGWCERSGNNYRVYYYDCCGEDGYSGWVDSGEVCSTYCTFSTCCEKI